MAKTYFNDAVIGNSRMLGCITEKGELVRMFWPNIDYPQHIESMLCGVFIPSNYHSTVWLNEDCFNRSQSYIEDTNILRTVYVNHDRQISIEQVDFVMPDNDIVIRHYEIENIGHEETDIGFMVFSAGISTNQHMGNILFDFKYDSLIHYRNNYYISISADSEAWQFQLGNNAYDAARHTGLRGNDSIGMMPDGAVSWKLGNFKAGEKKCLTLSICAAHTLRDVKKLTAYAKKLDYSIELHKTEQYWRNYIQTARKISTGRDEVDSLYKRSLLVFKLMSDEKTGGLLAAPEIDEGFTRCGRYAYCWGRDAAFITGALDRCGLVDVVDRFYKWAVNVQDEDGSWQQRYYMDGNLAPSWGMQVDETGTLIWGMLEHYKVTGSMVFLESVWESVKKGVEFMVDFIDPDTGLPRPSYDLWEERYGEHTYSSAAVYGGIKAGADMARILGKDEALIVKWDEAAEKIKQSIVKNMWKEERNCFIRSIRTKLNPWGREHSEHTTIIRVNPKDNYRDVTLEDWTVDISLLGVSIPFEVFDVHEPKVRSTVETIERVLASHRVGGLKRYEHDNYMGGNPWILTTMWAALYYTEAGNYQKAKEYFEWAVKAKTKLGLLPEQIDRETGRPAWVIPLTWSHAMFVLTFIKLADAGVI